MGADMSDSSSRDNDNAAIAATLANAQAAVADLADQYIGWVNEDLVRLEAAAKAAEGSTAPDKLTAIYDVAHDIKGQGEQTPTSRAGRPYWPDCRLTWGSDRKSTRLNSSH